MAYKFSESKLLAAQTEIERYLAAQFPSDRIAVLSRRRGNLENDIEASVAQLGNIAVAVEAALPSDYGDTVSDDVDIKTEIEIHILEDILLLSSNPVEIDGVSVNASNVLEGVIKCLNTFRIFGDSHPIFKPVRNFSEGSITHFALPVEFGAVI